MTNDSIDKDVDKVKEELKKRYKPADYEALIDFAARYFVSDSRQRIDMGNFYQAMLNMEFARADHNKEAENHTKEAFKGNSLFEAFLHLESYSTKSPRWKIQKSRHANDIEAKNLVLSWWGNDKALGYKKNSNL